MPDDHSPPPFFGLRPARTVMGRTVHRVVRRMLASTMRAGVLRYNDILARHGIAPIPLDGFPHMPLASARRVFLNGCPGLEFPGYRPLDNAEYVGALVPARSALGPDTPLPAAVVQASDAKVVAVSQGTVDNADPNKLIVSTLEALKDGPYVVVATTAGTQTEQLRERFAAPNVVIEDFINYDDLFPHVDVFVTNGGFGSVLAAMRHGVPVVAAGKREGKNDINARIGWNRLGVDMRSERPRPATNPLRGAPRSRRPDVRRQRVEAACRARLIRPDGPHRSRAPRQADHRAHLTTFAIVRSIGRSRQTDIAFSTKSSNTAKCRRRTRAPRAARRPGLGRCAVAWRVRWLPRWPIRAFSSLL